MEVIPTSVTGGVAGALASHQVARAQLAERVRRKRLAEAAGETEASEGATDAPVAHAAPVDDISSQLPDSLPPAAIVLPAERRKDAEESHDHVDVVG